MNRSGSRDPRLGIRWLLPELLCFAALMSLLVHVFVLDADGKMQLLEEPRGVSDLAGFENWRTQVWGSEVVRSLGARFFPALADGDLEVAAGQVPAFKDECLLLRENLETIVTQTAAGRTAEEHRNTVSQRLAHIEDAVRRAQAADGGVLIW
jgi:hypothetical protein